MGIGIGILLGLLIVVGPAVVIIRSGRTRGGRKWVWATLSLVGIPLHFVLDEVIKQSLDHSTKTFLFDYMAASQKANLVTLVVGWAVLVLYFAVTKRAGQARGPAI